MDFQLVLQFKRDDLPDFDTLINLEDQLRRVVEPVAEVDGHDMGSGEMNIFILTSDPVSTFERAKPLLSNASLLHEVGAAFRALRSEDFTVIWPENSTDAFVVI